ncbi:MAG: hypothetical protein B9S32_08585 [Verrucomicrobia bacterium Tous-C9LFEB]|nr:MAG: hypothetical protein B9S32_08585 [Verrucomicrobia bacterium Tous-C9LFEB]
MTLVQLLICGGIILAGYALMQWPSGLLRKTGVLFFCGASALGVYYLSGQWWLGFIVLVGWVLFPVSELIYILRKLRVPRDRILEVVPRAPEQFEELHGLTHDLAQLGFRPVEDCEWYSPMHTQFYRLFVHESEPYHAGLSYIYNEQFGFHFVSFSSQDKSGCVWLTWDYPLTYGLKMPPDVALFRALDCETASDLLEQHKEFLAINNVEGGLVPTPVSAEAARARLDLALRKQLDYNLHEGILSPERISQESFRYSWRGTLYVTSQVLRDLVRL